MTSERQSTNAQDVFSETNADDAACCPPDIHTDGREKGDWKSRYPDEARVQIRWELVYIFALLSISLSVIFLNWIGILTAHLSLAGASKKTFTTFIYYMAGGLLGGTTFGGKYLYRVVGRGFWSQDRRIWRILSPFVAMVIGLVIGAMIECGLSAPNGYSSGTRSFVIGFLAGYFADKAVGYLCDIADVIFGKRN
ncbi:MAG: hypothetical protein PWQ57_1740 [Desulfovibrionales bacterium]|nr:hypothetical protein [Desulfovibrionales bacterium]